MKAKEWKEIIIKSCEDAGTYKPYFDSIIETLSQILETRDLIEDDLKEYVDEIINVYNN